MYICIYIYMCVTSSAHNRETTQTLKGTMSIKTGYMSVYRE